jgi:hypothetical protein
MIHTVSDRGFSANISQERETAPAEFSLMLRASDCRLKLPLGIAQSLEAILKIRLGMAESSVFSLL